MTSNQQPFHFRVSTLILISGFLLVSSLAPVVGHAAYPVYSEPAAGTSAPQYDPNQIPEIINVAGTGTVSQQKKGSFLIGPTDAATCTGSNTAGCAKFCLNPDLTNFPGTSDTPNCILSWKDLNVPSSGFLKLFDGTGSASNLPPYGNPGNPVVSTATRDAGYVGWQAVASGIAQSQLFSFIAETPTGTANTGSGMIRPAAIVAEGETNSNFAAQFLGTLGVVGLGAGSPRLCLNDQAGGGGSCISQWSDLAALGNNQIVTLQDLHATQHFLDQGQTATSGTLVAGSIVAGQPIATTPLAYSCGNNICESPVETKANCSVDCH